MRVTLKIRLLLRRFLRPAIQRTAVLVYLSLMVLMFTGENFTLAQFTVLWRAALIIFLCMFLAGLM